MTTIMPFDVAWVRSHFPGREIHWFDSIDTTMREAARLSAAGCPEGTVIVAGEQTAGIGRHGHAWHSEACAGLYVSVILDKARREGFFPALTLAIGLATRAAIQEATGVDCDLRWPNDLLAGDRKCTGILVNVEPTAAIAGIGINVNHDSFPPEIAAVATSLRLASGMIHSREAVLVSLLKAIDKWSVAPLDQVLAEFTRRSSFVRGRRVIVDDKTSGVTAGLDAQGFLLLDCDNGQTIRILAGGVRPLE